MTRPSRRLVSAAKRTKGRVAVGPTRVRRRLAGSGTGAFRSFDEVVTVLETATEPAEAVWATLAALTAGAGLGFNRAFLLQVHGDELRGTFAVGPRTRDEAAALWKPFERDAASSLHTILRPGPNTIAREQARHAEMLSRLGHPLLGGYIGSERAYVARPMDRNPCVRHWLQVLESRALAVIPLRRLDQLWGVILADNFVTHRPIGTTALQVAEALAHALRIALDRTQLLARLTREHHQRLAAEQATTLLDAARDLVHDLKNPLALAGGLARELAEGQHRDAVDLDRRLRLIADAVRRTEDRVASLADGIAAKAAEVAVERVDVGKLVERVVEMFRAMARAQNVRLICYHPSRPLLATASPTSLERCLENLIGNALNAFGSHRGTVSVAVTEVEEWVTVKVADDGPPLPPQIRVDPFGGGISTHRGGSGLGLASAQRLMSAMGGRIEYDEHEPGWVCFTLWLRRWA